MASVIDVKTLSKEDVIHLIKDLLHEKLITREILDKIADKNNHSEDDLAYIERLVNKHFEEYDEIFRKLA